MKVLSVLIMLGAASSAAAQGSTVTTGSKFVPGGQVIFSTDFSHDPVGNFPSGLKYVRGSLEVVQVNGVPMLRSSSPGEFIIPLRAPLPQDFTLEFDLVARNSNCCSGEELAFEGSPQLNRSVGSAWVAWHHQYTGIIGGGQDLGTSTVTFPEDLQNELIGQAGQIQIQMTGTQFKLFTNGRQIYNLPNLVFRRTTVLRVFLGGVDDGTGAVYLARVRLATGGVVAVTPPASPGAIAGLPGSVPPPAPVVRPTSSPPTPTTSSQSSASTGGPVPTVVAGVTVTQGPLGPIVSWLAVAAPAIYQVQRWKIDDVACCSGTSPASPPLTGPPWQDTPLPLPGTYVYEVTVSTSAGSASGQAQFVNLKSAGQLPPGGPGPRTPTPLPVPPPMMPSAPGATGTPPAVGLSPTVTLGATGPVVTWAIVPGASSYGVQRWKIDDLNCCNNASGRIMLSGPPWPDMPLPVSGTYVYQVTASTARGVLQGQTQFTYQQAGGPPAPGPIAVIPVTPPTGTITPMPPSQPAPPPASPLPNPIRRPTGTLTTVGTGPAPANLYVYGSATTATVTWDPVVGAVGYVVNRAPVGTTNWTAVTPAPITVTTGPLDLLPDRSLTYTYQVQAYQADGTFGSATVDFTAPPPGDPPSFTGTQTGAGEVTLSWVSVGPMTNKYLLSGPGLGTGVFVDEVHMRTTYKVTGLPVGLHTWTVATSYQPGGILTAGSAWPTATVNVVATLPTSGKYQVVVESVKVEGEAYDDILETDGYRNEFYVSASVRTFSLASAYTTLSTQTLSSAIHGDIRNWPPPARVRAGSGSPTGGVAVLDSISPIWAPAVAGQAGWTRFVLWEGTLGAQDAVVISPSVWESDDEPSYYSDYVKTHLRNPSGIDRRVEEIAHATSGDVTPFVLADSIDFYLFLPHDRPIGLRSSPPGYRVEARAWTDHMPFGYYFDTEFVLTLQGIEAKLTRATPDPGLISIRFKDRDLGPTDPYPDTQYGSGIYVLNLRIVRIP